MSDRDDERRLAEQWMGQWRDAAEMLAAQRAAELRALTADEALEISERVLAFADPDNLPESRLRWSGLVEQQALFHGSNRE